MTKMATKEGTLVTNDWEEACEKGPKNKRTGIAIVSWISTTALASRFLAHRMTTYVILPTASPLLVRVICPRGQPVSQSALRPRNHAKG